MRPRTAAHTHRLVVLAPLAASVAFGLTVFLARHFPDSVIPGAVLLPIGILAAVGGCAFGIALAVRRRQPRWLLVSLACVLSVLLLAFAGLPAGLR